VTAGLGSRHGARAQRALLLRRALGTALADGRLAQAVGADRPVAVRAGQSRLAVRVAIAGDEGLGVQGAHVWNHRRYAFLATGGSRRRHRIDGCRDRVVTGPRRPRASRPPSGSRPTPPRLPEATALARSPRGTLYVATKGGRSTRSPAAARVHAVRRAGCATRPSASRSCAGASTSPTSAASWRCPDAAGDGVADGGAGRPAGLPTGRHQNDAVVPGPGRPALPRRRDDLRRVPRAASVVGHRAVVPPGRRRRPRGGARPAQPLRPGLRRAGAAVGDRRGPRSARGRPRGAQPHRRRGAATAGRAAGAAAADAAARGRDPRS
jgi:hypothetical protein